MIATEGPFEKTKTKNLPFSESGCFPRVRMRWGKSLSQPKVRVLLRPASAGRRVPLKRIIPFNSDRMVVH